MIDTITWNTGSQGTADNSLLNPTNMYNYERSKNSGKICSMNNRCNDTVVRTVTWVGQVGLMYPSDYGYATIGSTSKSREACLETSMYSWGESENSSCKGYNWLLTRGWQWTMTPAAYSSDSAAVFNIYGDGRLRYHSAFGISDVYPTVYLKEDVKYILGDGTVKNPYRICA